MKTIYTRLMVVLFAVFASFVFQTNVYGQVDLTVTIVGKDTVCMDEIPVSYTGSALGIPPPITYPNPRWDLPDAALYCSPLNAATTWFTPPGPGTYHIRYTAIDGNSVSWQATKTIVVLPNAPLSNVTPLTVTVCQGDPVTLTASGAIDYAWYKDDCLGGPITTYVGGGSTYNFIANTTGTCMYRVFGAGQGGCSTAPQYIDYTVITNTAATVNAGSDTTICAGTNATLNGQYGGAATSATWTTSGTGTFSPNATTLNATYIPSAADIAAGTVTLTLTTNDPAGVCPAAVDFMILTITPAIAGNTIAADQTICSGSIPAGLTGSVPTGGGGGYTYQWQSSTAGAGGPFTDIVGATGQNYAPPALAASTWYRRIVNTGICSNSISNVIAITVNPPIANNIIAADQTICRGTIPTPLTGSTPTGGNGVYTYQWQRSVVGAGGPFVNIAGATGINYSPAALVTTTWYRRIVTSPPCSNSTSNVIQITVNPLIANNTIAADQTICSGDVPAGLTGSLPTGGNGTYTYQWQSSTAGVGGPFTNIAGATGQNYAPGALTMNTWYRRVVTSPPCANSTSNVIAITVNPAIAGNTIAADQTICSGDIPAGLTGTVPTGGNGTYTYQWQSSTTGAGGPFTNIVGATGQNYAPGVLAATTWFRRVVTSPPCTNSTSNVVQITVDPVIANNIIAADQTICSGSIPAGLTGTVPTGGSGTYTYQWQSSTAGAGGPFTNIAGATGQNYAPGALAVNTWYRRIVTSLPCGNSTSNVIAITVNPAIAGNTIAADQTICSGDIPVGLTGTVPTGGNGTYAYQWQSSTTGAGGPFTDIAGATGQNYAPGALATTTWYRRVVTSPPCANSISNVIQITVNPVIANNIIAADQTICSGDIPTGLTGTIPTGGNGTYTYQWQSSTTGAAGPFTNIAGATGQNYAPGALTVTTWYRRMVTSAPCPASPSNVVQITVNPAIANNTIAADQTICSGDIPVGLTGTVPTGGNGTYTYQWQSSTTGAAGPFTNIAGATGQNYAPGALTMNTWYRRIVTSPPCANSTSNVIQITVNPAIANNTIAADQTICSGDIPAGLTGTVPTGGNGTYTYQWQSSTTGAGGPFTNIAGATGQNYAPGALAATTWYRRMVTSAPCPASPSNVVQITVNPAIANNTIAADQTICSGDTPAGLTGTVPTGGNGTYTYQWQSSTTGAAGPFTNIAGATGQNYAPGALAVTTWYRRMVTSAPCPASPSNVIQITVNPAIANNIIAADQTICSGDTPAGLTGTIPTGGNGTYAYQWQSSTTGAGGPFTNIAGATGQNYVPGALVTTTWYRRIVTSPPCANSTSNVIQITVNPAIANNTIAADQTICSGDIPAGLTGSIPTGGNGTYTYQWQISTTGAGGPFTNIAGATGQNYAPGSLTVTTWYRRMVTSAPCPASPSNVIQITVNPAIANNIIAADQTICSGDTPAGLTGTIPTGGNGTYTYQWQSSTTGAAGPFTDIAGATGQNYAPGALMATTWFRRMVTSPPCTASPSNVIQITVNPVIANNTIAADQTICSGDIPAVLNGSIPTGGNGTYTYQWQSSTTGVAGPFTDIAGATGQNYAPGALTVTTWYRRMVTSPPCSASPSNVIQITVNPAIANNIIAADQTICTGTIPSLLTGTIPTGGSGVYTYQWQSSTAGAAGPFTDIAGATGQNYQPGALAATTWYRRMVTSAPCPATPSNVICITVNPAIGNNIISANQTICSGEMPALLTGTLPTGGNGTYTYQWQSRFGPVGPFVDIVGATGQNYQPGILPIGTTWFRRVVSSPPCGNSISNLIRIDVNQSPVAHAGPDNTICINDTITLGDVPAATGGNPPYTYLWYTVPASGWTSNLPNPQVFPTVTTTYVLQVTDQTPCIGRDTVVISIWPNTLNANAGPDQHSCNGINGGNFILGGFPTASGGQGPYTYLWSSTPTYAWDPGQNTLSNPVVHPTVNTQFCVTVTDAHGCTATDCILITLDPILYADAGDDDTICFGLGGRLGGDPTAWGGTPFGLNPPYIYTWTSNPVGFTSTEPNPVVFPTSCTTYYLEVEDANGCRAWDTVVICLNDQLFANAGNDTTICNGNNGGSVVLGHQPNVASGGTPPYTYTWMVNPPGFVSFSNLEHPIVNPTVTTTYGVTVRDNFGCWATDQVVVTVNPEIIANAGPDGTMCNPNNGGTYTLGGSPTGSGGTAPLTYLWSSNPNDPTLAGQTTIANPIVIPTVQTTYTVIVNDASGMACGDTDIVVVSISTEIFADAGTDQVLCGGTAGFVTLGGTPAGIGGNPPLSYLWNTIPVSAWTSTSQNPMVNPTVTTTYELVVTDGILCIDRDTVVVVVDPRLNANAGRDEVICTSDSLITITLGSLPPGRPTASGGTPPYTYLWASNPPGITIPSVANPVVTYPTSITPVTFTVIVSDSFGICHASDSKIVTINAFFEAYAGEDTTLCGPGSVTLGDDPLTGGGVPPFVYAWSSAPHDITLDGHENEAHPVVTPTVTTDYFLHVIDQNGVGCDAYDTVRVIIDSPVVIDSITYTMENICGDSTGTATVWAHGGTPPLTYLWNTVPAQTTQTATGLTAGVLYTVTVTSGLGQDGCHNTGSVILPSPFAPHGTLSILPNDTICLGEEVTIIANSDTTISTFEFRINDITVLGPGVHTNHYTTTINATSRVTVVIDSLGCKLILQDTIWTSQLPNVNAGRDTVFPCPPSDSLQIGSPGVPGYQYTWTLVPSGGQISDPNVPMPWVLPNVTTTYILNVHDSISGCNGVDSVVLTVPDWPLLFNDEMWVCRDSCVTIGPSNIPPNCIFNWTSIPPYFNSNLQNPTVCPRFSTMYVFTMIDTITNCLSKGYTTINVYGTIYIPGTDTLICVGDTITIGGPPQPHYSYTWTSNPEGFHSTISNPTVHPEWPTWYILALRDSVYGCNLIDTFFVDIDIPPVFAGNDTLVCIGDSATIGSYWPLHDAYIYSWRSEPPGFISNWDSVMTVLPIDTTTLYILTVTSRYTGCSSIDTIIVKSLQIPDITLTSDKLNDVIYQGQIITFTAMPDNYSEYRFYINGELAQSGPSNIFKTDRITFDQTYVTCIALNWGCDSQPDTIIVNLKSIPNAFTPNGDGINDIFLEGMDLTIINRWGQTMYVGTKGWDGKYNGQKVSPGTYYYLLKIKDLNNITTVLKGAVTIIDIKQ